MKSIFVVLTCTGLLLTEGLGQETNGPTESVEQTDPSVSGSGMGLSLNQGQKWVVHDHMAKTIDGMAELIEGTTTISSTNEAIALALAFDRQLGVLVNQCTMSGPAHDQLHLFLTQLFPRVAELKQQTEIGKLQTIRDEIQALFDAYDQHFE